MSEPADRTIVHTLPDLTIGGGQVLLASTIEGAGIATPHDRHIVVSLADGPIRDRLHTLGATTEICTPHSLPSLLRRLRSRRPAVVHANNTSSDRLLAQTIATALRLPLVNTLHGIAPGRSPRDASRIANRLLTRQIDHHVAVSEAVAGSYQDALGIPDDRVSVVPPCLSLERLAPPDASVVADTRCRLLGDEDDDTRLLLSVCRLVEGKHPALLVEVLAELRRRGRPVRLVFVGDGPLSDETSTTARRLGVDEHVVFLGERKDVTTLLAAADVFVSASEAEGFGLTLLEAMATRTPVVAFDLAGYRGFAVDQVTARLVPRFGTEAFASAIDATLELADETDAIVARAAAQVDRHRPERRAEAVARIYDQVVHRPATPTSRQG